MNKKVNCLNEADFSKIIEEAIKEPIDKDIDLTTLKNVTNGNVDSESIVIKNNQELTNDNYSIVCLYGFNDYLSLYRYAKSINYTDEESSRKITLNRYSSPIEIYNSVNSINTPSTIDDASYQSDGLIKGIAKSEIKNPLPNKANNPKEDTPESTENIDSLTYGLIGETLDKVSDTAISQVKEVPKSFQVNGSPSLNYDNYAYINLNGVTIAILGLEIDKNIHAKYLAYNPEYKNLISEFVKALALISRDNKKDLVLEKELFEDNPIISLLSTKESNKQATIKLKDICLED